MNVTITQTEQQTQVELTGRIDTISSQEFLDTVEKAFRVEHPEIVINCKGLEYISSSGLRAWLTLHKTALQHGGRLTLLNLNPQVMEVLQMTGLSSVFTLV